MQSKAMWGALVFLVTIIIGGCVAIHIADDAMYSPIPFDAAVWRSGDVRQRGRMVVDLQRQRILIGKSRDEIIELLGPPDGPGTMNYDWVRTDFLSDWLNLPYSDWRQWLYVEFDPKTGLVDEVGTRD